VKPDRRLNILICPLEWGLGHSGRMIPLARKLQERQNNIFIGTGKEHRSFFRNELSEITYIDFQGFKTDYSRYLPQYIALLLKMPLLFYSIIAEHFKLKKIIKTYKIDIVISDNRMGLWNRRIKCVYITHLPVIPLPEKLVFLEWIGILFHRYFIRKYSFCFIPDLPGVTNLTGRLTHNLKMPRNTRFIGILSRFGTSEPSAENKRDFVHNTIILSGPEPQRSILRQQLVSILNDAEPPTVILEGRPGKDNVPVRTGNIISYNHMASDKMQDIISGSEAVITRSGYTTIMELISLNCSALLIPTPGQTEQEYLAKYLSGKGWFTTVTQKSIREGITLSTGKTSWPSGMIYESRELLEKALDELLNK
jgi:hypothetical protein